MSQETHRRKPNRLAGEKSPYLLQHAHNPVDWYPWGDEAFDKARREDRPIFLSIGYSTCHWCHVMERESFEDEEIAALLNRDFVSIKVDREERPDVDRVYMTAVQALTGHGGWPLSAFLTPDLEPFYAGTYFPPRSRWGRPGFMEVLAHIRRAWDEKREGVLESAREITAALRRFAEGVPGARGETEPEALLRNASARLVDLHDDRLGGFGGAPKFPRPTQTIFLLRESRRRDDPSLAEPALHTLREMWRGGIHDHLGGGFHRYSVDAYWRVPHFEKMLYDQAQLVWAYLDAYQLTGDAFYADAARDIADYVLHDLEHGDGGFYSAEDADSAADPARPDDKEEGAFYLWELDEIRDLLEPEQLEVAIHRFGLSDGGNTISDPQGELGTRNVLYAARGLEAIAATLDLARDRVSTLIESARSKLLEQRQTRPRPHLDDKILTSWNGLMISALARAGAVLDEDRYRQAAARAARFVLEHNRQHDGALVRRFRDGEAGQPAQLDDYAFLALGLLDLYEATFDPKWLATSLELTEAAVERFGDGDAHFYDSDGEDDSVLVRSRTLVDGAEPAGTSALVHLLLRLGWALSSPRLRQLGEAAFGAALRDSQGDPSSAPWLLGAADLVLGPPTQVIFRGDRDSGPGRDLVRAAHRPFAPDRVLLWLEPETEALLDEGSPELPPLDADREALAYLCRDFRCELPTADPTQLRARLAGSD